MTDRAHGARADATVIRDIESNAFVIGPLGQVVPVSIAGSAASLSGGTGQPVGLAQRLQREMNAVLRFLGFEDAARELAGVIHAGTDSGSTTSAVVIKNPVIENDAVGGGTLFIEDGITRPGYAIATITGGNTVNLVSAMSEAAPASGVAVTIWPKDKPRPSVSDFPSGKAFGFKDGSGNWYVIDADATSFKVYRASLSGSTLSKVASGSGALDLKIGATAGNANITVAHKPQGDWDFSDATVTGLSGGGGAADLDDVMGIIDFGF